MRAAVVAAIVAIVAGCGGGQTNRPRVVAVTKLPPGPPPVAAPKPCEGSPGGDLLDGDAAEGERLVDVCLRGASPETTAAVRERLELGPGKTLTASAVRRDLHEAYKTGLLDQIEATARKDTAGVVLYLALEEHSRITAVTFEGMVPLPNDPLVAAFPKAGARLDKAAVFDAGQKLKADYAKRGWEEATVSHVVMPDGSGHAKLKIVVVEGVRSKVGKVTFTGTRGGRETALRKAIDLDEGAPFGDDKLARASSLIDTFYYENGFANVKVEEAKRTRAADGTTAITFPIVEGPLVRIGKIRVSKVDAATEKEILAVVQIKSGEIFKRSKVMASIEAIRALPRRDGKKLDASTESWFDASTAIMDLGFVISER